MPHPLSLLPFLLKNCPPHSFPHAHTTVPRPPRSSPVSAWAHSSWALATTTPLLPSCSGSPFPASVQDPGLHVWRVEKLKPVPVARESQGVFFSGDSYLVLHNGPEELSHLHLWIGKEAAGQAGGVAPAGAGAGMGLTGLACPSPPLQASSPPGTSRGPALCWPCISTPCLGSGPCSTERCRAMSPTSS